MFNNLYRLYMACATLFIIVVCFMFAFGSCIFDKSPEEYDTWDKEPINYNVSSPAASSQRDTVESKTIEARKESDTKNVSSRADIDVWGYDDGYTMGFEDGKKGRTFGKSIEGLDHDAEFEEGYEDGYSQGRSLREEKKEEYDF